MSEHYPDPIPKEDASEHVATPEEQARAQRWEEYISPLHGHLRHKGISFGEHSGSHYDRLIHGPAMVEFIMENGGEGQAIEAAMPAIKRHITGKPTRIVPTPERIFELLKPSRDSELRLNRAKRDKILERSRNEYRSNATIAYGLRLHEAVSSDTSFGGVTLDAVAALTLALEKAMRQQQAG